MFLRNLMAIKAVRLLVNRKSVDEGVGPELTSRRKVLKQLLFAVPVAVGLIAGTRAAAGSKTPPKTPRTPPKTHH